MCFVSFIVSLQNIHFVACNDELQREFVGSFHDFISMRAK